jgi:hypothetical protein
MLSLVFVGSMLASLRALRVSGADKTLGRKWGAAARGCLRVFSGTLVRLG